MPEADIIRFIGRLHVVLLHAPIGLMVAVVLTELAVWRDDGTAARVRRGLLWVTLLSAIVSAVTGWLLADEPGYESETITWHRWLGIAAAVVLLLAAFFDLVSRTALRRLALFTACLLLIVTGHLGGTVTHGRLHLAEHAPDWLRPVVGDVTAPAVVETSDASGATGSPDVFAALRISCIECHGPDKQKGRLRLDTPEGIASVVTPGAAPDSELFRRITLPAGDFDAMPPDGPPLDDATILAFMHWINTGASTDALIEESVEVEEAEQDEALSLTELRAATGALVVAMTDEPGAALRIDFSRANIVPSAEAITAISSVRERVVELSFAGLTLDAAVLAELPELPALERLHLERTNSDDDMLVILDRMPKLAYLNLHTTNVGDSIFDHARGLANLERLALYGTNVTDTAAEAFRSERPEVEVTTTIALEPPFDVGEALKPGESPDE